MLVLTDEVGKMLPDCWSLCNLTKSVKFGFESFLPIFS